MPEGWQRQRHGVSKNLAEGIGGALIGAAAVLLLREWIGRRCGAPAAVAAPAATPPPAATETEPEARSRRRADGHGEQRQPER